MAALVGRIAGSFGNIVQGTKGGLARFWPYFRAELAPPGPSEFGEVSKGFQNIIKSARTGKWKELSVKQAWLNGLVAAECCFFFFIGECMGKGAIIGYPIPGAMHFELMEGGANSSEGYFAKKDPEWKPPTHVQRDYDH